ncbi:MAG TPA: hypothetical protein VN408_00290, partial [Actinoplanes sp.]|nr:hypothetical protein [Actinoplanes sp.]
TAAYGMGDIVLIRALITAGARQDVTAERTGEPLMAWLETARPDVFAAIADLEDHAARSARCSRSCGRCRRRRRCSPHPRTGVRRTWRNVSTGPPVSWWP